jgi:hypothetical protein
MLITQKEFEEKVSKKYKNISKEKNIWQTPEW